MQTSMLEAAQYLHSIKGMPKESFRRTEELKKSIETKITQALNCFLDTCKLKIYAMYKQR